MDVGDIDDDAQVVDDFAFCVINGNSGEKRSVHRCSARVRGVNNRELKLVFGG